LIFLSTFYFEAKYLKFIPSQPNIGIVSRSWNHCRNSQKFPYDLYYIRVLCRIVWIFGNCPVDR
jgi:hypothetical protein